MAVKIKTKRKIGWNTKKDSDWNINNAINVLSNKYHIESKYKILLTAEREANARYVQFKNRDKKVAYRFRVIRDKLKNLRRQKKDEK